MDAAPTPRRRATRVATVAMGVVMVFGSGGASTARADGRSASPFKDSEALDIVVAPPRVPSDEVDELAAFPYVVPPEKHYLRAGVEVFSVLAVGLVDYLLNTQARGGHLNAGDKQWDLRYVWDTFRTKLTGVNYHLDTNQFNTNFISHPFAGTLYYTAARSNHLSVGESFAYATIGAFAWEYFGEIREAVSVNDAIVTPVSGAVIGETTLQLCSFFKRGRKNFANTMLAFAFGPARVFNDWADGGEPLRSDRLDDLGLTTDEWHRFTLSAGEGATWQSARHAGAAPKVDADTRLSLDMEVVNLPGYGGVAKRADGFDDANASHLRFETTLSEGQLIDAVFATDVMPAGYYWRDATLDAARRPEGSGALVGMRAAFEYGVHTYDRDGAQPRDVVAIVSPLGITAEFTHDAGKLRVRSRLELGGEMAGVQSFALGAYRQGRTDANLQTVLKDQGYYHAFGATLVPSLSVTYGDFEVGGRLRLDSFLGIEGLDEQQQRIAREVPLADLRLGLRAWAAYQIPTSRLVVSGLVERLSRTGDVGDVRTSRSEVSLFGTLGLRL